MKTVVLLMVMVLLGARVNAQTITSANSGFWKNPATWVGNQVPGPSNNVVIAAGHKVTIDSVATSFDLITNSSGILHVNSLGGFYALIVNGSINNSGKIELFGYMKTNNNLTNQAGGVIVDNFGNRLTVMGNIVNDGNISLSNSSILMCGDVGTASTVAQTIGGTGNFNINSLGINNNNVAGVSLLRALWVKAVQLFTGKFFLGNNNLTSNSFNTVGNNTTYIVTNGTGRVRSGATSPTFPIGHSTANPVGIGANTAHDTFSVRVFDNFTISPYGTSVVNSEWDIAHETGTADSIDVTLFWYASDEGAGFTRSNSYVSRYDGANWVPVSPLKAATSGVGFWQRKASGLSQFSRFGVASGTALVVTPKVTVVDADTALSCVANNGINYKITKGTLPYTVQLYRYGIAYGSSFMTNNHNVSFNNLPPGSYIVTARANELTGNAVGQSKSVAVVPTPVGANTSNIQSTKATFRWDTLGCVKYYVTQRRQQGTSTWTTKKTIGNVGSLVVTGLLPNTIYEWHVAAADSANGIVALSAYDGGSGFITDPAFTKTNTGEEDQQTLNDKLAPALVYPNPASSQLHIQLNTLVQYRARATIYLRNTTNQVVWSGSNIEVMKKIDIDVSSLPAGIYYLEIISGNNATKQKIVVVH